MISLTEVVEVWDELPDENGDSFGFEEFVGMVDRAIGVYNNIDLLDDVD